MNIAITGGIGAGKSTLLAHLQQAFTQAQFFSMDAFVDELYRDSAWLSWLNERFGTTDRTEISRLAFADPAVLAQLNAQSALKIGVRLGRILAAKQGMVFVEFPLLFESGLSEEFDHIVLVTADRDVRIARVVARGKKTPQQAAAVIDVQMPEERKAVLADAVIDTSEPDSQAACAEAIEAVVQAFLSSGQYPWPN